MIRLHVQAPLSAGVAIAPEPEQARYLIAVMRLGEGDEVALFNGRDGEWRARLGDVTKRGCTLTPMEQTRAQTFPPDLDLVMALVKRSPLELVVEKATELGVKRILLVTTRRTNADHTNVSRLQAIAAEAAEQCGRLEVPEIVAPEKLDRLLDTWPASRRLIYCDEAGADAHAGPDAKAFAPHSALKALAASPKGAWGVLIGPEGGFDPAERARLRSHPAVIGVTLGPRILRAESAAIAALTLWQATLGDW